MHHVSEQPQSKVPGLVHQIDVVRIALTTRDDGLGELLVDNKAEVGLGEEEVEVVFEVAGDVHE